MPVSVHPRGTTIYRPDHCYDGYAVVLLPGDGAPAVGLIDMNGDPVHRWQMDADGQKGGVPRARMFPDGRLLVLHSAESPWLWNGRLPLPWA